MRTMTARGFAALGLWALVSCLALVSLAPPAALPEGAPAEVFSAGRAMRRAAAISAQPHPSGSAEQAAVRDLLLRELGALGLEAEVQQTTAPAPPSGLDVALENVVARIPGSASSGAILLVAHYDSTAESPGGGDNATGVATVLETLRALRAGGQELPNEVLALFSDAEEAGLLGAWAFQSEHPWMARVRVVINLDTLVHGPAVMWRTGRDNGWLIGQFARAVAHPVANSWSGDTALFLPYDTDFAPFRQSGTPGFDFWTTYDDPEIHTPGDTMAHVDARSVQHAGQQALALVRRLGAEDLTNVRAPDAVYFSFLGSRLLHYPASWALWIAAVVALAYLVLLGLGLGARRLTWRGLAKGLGIAVGSLLLLPTIGVAAWRGLGALGPARKGGWPITHTRGDWAYFALLLALVMGLAVLVQRWARRRISLADSAAGALGPWMALALLSGAGWAAFSYMLAWPGVASLVALAWITFAPPRGGHWGGWTLLVLLAVPALALWAPAIEQYFAGMALSLVSPAYMAAVLVLQSLAPQAELLADQALGV
jgi:hypothetical protein